MDLDLLNINIDELEETKNYNIILNYKLFLNKIEYYNNYCLFCFYNKEASLIYSTYTCSIYKDSIEYIKNIVSKEASIIYTKKSRNIDFSTYSKDLDLELVPIYICSRYLLPISIYIYYRKNNTIKVSKTCLLYNKILITLSIIYKYK